jgi:thioredoxin 1
VGRAHSGYEKTFERIVLNTAAKDKVVLVDFYAEHVWNLQKRNGSLTLVLNSWCGPCKTLSPILQQLAEDASVKTGSGSSMDLVTVDIDQQIELGQKYQVGGI